MHLLAGRDKLRVECIQETQCEKNKVNGLVIALWRKASTVTNIGKQSSLDGCFSMSSDD